MITAHNNIEFKKNLLHYDEGHLWLAYLSKERDKQTTYWQSILSPDELERADTFKFSKDRHQFVAARGILRCLLSSYVGISPQNIEIVYGLWGKPRLINEKAIYFNLSHSENYALYAFSPQYEVGVDIEYIRKDIDIDEIAKNVFSIQEQAQLKLMPFEERVKFFFKIWVCKEAFLKAKGKGWLSQHQSFFVDRQECKEEEIKISSSGEYKAFPYYFESIPEYASALFMERPAKIRHYMWW